jgi:hypothetical protein
LACVTIAVTFRRGRGMVIEDSAALLLARRIRARE